MTGGYEQIYERILPGLGGCDFPEVAERLGMSLQPDGTLAVDFLGREYEISVGGVKAKDGKPVRVNNRSVLGYYTLSRGAGEPAGAYLPLAQLSGTIIVSSNTRWMTAPLGQAFCGKYPAFGAALRRLGGTFAGKLESAGYVWILPVLPKIFLQIIYHDRDDEFPCEVQILFDANATRFMEFECLAFLQGCLVREMLMNTATGDTRRV